MTPELFAAHHRQANGRKYGIDLQIITVARDLAPNFAMRAALLAFVSARAGTAYADPELQGPGPEKGVCVAVARHYRQIRPTLERVRSQGQSSKLSLPIDPSAPLGVDNPQCRWPGHR